MPNTLMPDRGPAAVDSSTAAGVFARPLMAVTVAVGECSRNGDLEGGAE